MPATISSTFDIVIDETIAAAGSVTIANPGRSYRVVSMFVTGSNNAVAALTRVGTAGNVAVSSLVTGDLNDFPSVITVANTAVDDENLLLSEMSLAAGITRAVIVCEAAVPEPLTVILT